MNLTVQIETLLNFAAMIKEASIDATKIANCVDAFIKPLASFKVFCLKSAVGSEYLTGPNKVY